MKTNGYTSLTDQELIEGIANNESGSFEELYNRYWKKLYLYGYRLIEDHEIRCDIVQEVFLDIWRRRHQLKIQHVSSFMYQMTKFQLAKRLRKNKVRKEHLDSLKEVAFVNQVQEQVEFSELKSYLSEVMSELPDKCRRVFYLSRFENLSNKEIGEQLHISVSTVEKHINKALKHIRKAMVHFN